MIRRFALISSLITLGAIAITPKAYAQEVNIDYNGKIEPSCTVANITNGKLALWDEDDSIMDANPLEATGAQPGSFELNCNGGAEISFGTPVAQNGSPSIGANRTELYDGDPLTEGTLLADVYDNGTNLANLTGPISNKTLYVTTAINNGGTPIPVGDYNYRVTLNITAK